RKHWMDEDRRHHADDCRGCTAFMATEMNGSGEVTGQRRITMSQAKLRNRLLGSLIFAAAMSVAVYALAQSNDESAVREALLQSASSFEKNDVAAATKVWANDESLTIFESGHANYGWADYRDHHLVPEMGEMKNTKYAFSDIRVHLAGNTAW